LSAGRGADYLRRFVRFSRERFFIWLPTAAILCAFAISLQAGTDVPVQKAETTTATDLYRRGTWEFSLESAYTFETIRFPTRWFVNYPGRKINPLNYNFATEMIGARYRLTGVGGPGILRGSLQGSVTFVGTAIIEGAETYYAGLALGLHYDFVQARARLVPFIELRGGPGFTDSTSLQYAQQQDLTFTYLLSAGLRYDINPRWTATLGAVDQHLSNFFMADHNYGVDSVGINVGVLKRF
jgi:hypothetical protein